LEVVRSSDTERANRIPPGQSATEDWPVLHFGEVPKIDARPWRLRILGQVEQERSLSLQEFLALPMTQVFSDVHCVTGWSLLNSPLERG
jgi:DMSO/TMAO reductase YedYZ molybdopterin-dependent catalytic subunit